MQIEQQKVKSQIGTEELHTNEIRNLKEDNKIFRRAPKDLRIERSIYILSNPFIERNLAAKQHMFTSSKKYTFLDPSVTFFGDQLNMTSSLILFGDTLINILSFKIIRNELNSILSFILFGDTLANTSSLKLISNGLNNILSLILFRNTLHNISTSVLFGDALNNIDDKTYTSANHDVSDSDDKDAITDGNKIYKYKNTNSLKTTNARLSAIRNAIVGAN